MGSGACWAKGMEILERVNLGSFISPGIRYLLAALNHPGWNWNSHYKISSWFLSRYSWTSYLLQEMLEDRMMVVLDCSVRRDVRALNQGEGLLGYLPSAAQIGLKFVLPPFQASSCHKKLKDWSSVEAHPVLPNEATGLSPIQHCLNLQPCPTVSSAAQWS